MNTTFYGSGLRLIFFLSVIYNSVHCECFVVWHLWRCRTYSLDSGTPDKVFGFQNVQRLRSTQQGPGLTFISNCRPHVCKSDADVYGVISFPAQSSAIMLLIVLLRSCRLRRGITDKTFSSRSWHRWREIRVNESTYSRRSTARAQPSTSLRPVMSTRPHAVYRTGQKAGPP